ncbi:MAG: RNA polymerase sigma factor [Acidimicrobiales bacterium]
MVVGEAEQRFRALYRWSRPRLLAYAIRRTSSPEDAADVVSETFAVAWRRLDDVPPGDEGLLWLYAACRRVIANHSRREARRSELTRRMGIELRAAVADPLDAGPDELLAVHALRNIAADDREILMLVGWEGLSGSQLARVLGCSPTAARIRLHRARARLVREMERLGLVTKHQRASRHSHHREPVPTDTPKGA